MSDPEIRYSVRVTQGKPITTHTIRDVPAGTRFRSPPKGHTDFVDARLVSIDFSGVIFDRFLSEGSAFESCNFSGVRFSRGGVQAWIGSERPTLYRECNFDKADMRKVNLGDTRFERCTFRGSRIEMWFASAAEFVDCVFEGAIRECTFYGKVNRVLEPRMKSDREVNEFRGNDFSRAMVRDCVFRDGIDLDAQRLPTGPEYLWLRSFRRRIAPTRAALVRRLRGEELERALRYLHMFETMYRGQLDVWLDVREDVRAPGYLDVVRLLAGAGADPAA